MLKGRPRPTTPSKNTGAADNATTSSGPPPPSTPILKERSPEKRSPPKAILRSPLKTSLSYVGGGGIGPPPSHHHWSKTVKEVTIVTSQDGVFNFRISGGSDHGEFPVVSDVLPPDTRGVEYRGGGGSSGGEHELVTQVCIFRFTL